MQVFLIHGMGRSRLSMLPLARHLRRHGHQPSLHGYSVATRSLDAIAERFLAELQRARAGSSESYAIVGHSLGNVITRVLSDRLPEGLTRFVMLAPPNRSPALARAMRRQRLSPLYRLFTGDAGERLGDRTFYASLRTPAAPTLIIAGDRAIAARAYRGSAPNDGVVSVAETQLDDLPHAVVPAIHTWIMNHPQARGLITHFLRHGQLD